MAKVSKGYQWTTPVRTSEPYSNVRIIGATPVNRRHNIPMCSYRPERRMSCIHDDFINRRSYSPRPENSPKWVRDLNNFIDLHVEILGPMLVGAVFFVMTALWLWLT